MVPQVYPTYLNRQLMSAQAELVVVLNWRDLASVVVLVPEGREVEERHPVNYPRLCVAGAEVQRVQAYLVRTGKVAPHSMDEAGAVAQRVNLSLRMNAQGFQGPAGGKAEQVDQLRLHSRYSSSSLLSDK